MAQKLCDFNTGLSIKRVKKFLEKYPEIRNRLMKIGFGDLEQNEYFMTNEKSEKILFSDQLILEFLGQDDITSDSIRDISYKLLFEDTKRKFFSHTLEELDSLSINEFSELLVKELLTPLKTKNSEYFMKTPISISDDSVPVNILKQENEVYDPVLKIMVPPNDTSANRKKYEEHNKKLRKNIDEIFHYLRRFFGKNSLTYRLALLEKRDIILLGRKRRDSEYARELKTSINYISQCRKRKRDKINSLWTLTLPAFNIEPTPIRLN